MVIQFLYSVSDLIFTAHSFFGYYDNRHDVDRACAIHGLAVVGGLISSTGVIGLSIGGGIGWLSRTYGLSCDSIVEVEIVLANGTLITATPDHYPDLFWSHHGGGGNFGVIISLVFRAHRLAPPKTIALPERTPTASSSASTTSSSTKNDTRATTARQRSPVKMDEEYNAPVGHACLVWSSMSVELLTAFDQLAASLPSTVAAYCFLQRFPRSSSSLSVDDKDRNDDKNERVNNPMHTVMMFVNNHGMMTGEKIRHTHYDASILESELVSLVGELISQHPPRTMDIQTMEYTQVPYYTYHMCPI
jgi:hypothetical protein